MTAGNSQLRLRITSDPANLAPVRKEIEAFCAASGFDPTTTGEVVLCINEALANITRHAYGGATDQPVHLDAQFADDVLRVKIRDWGCGVEPADRLPPRDPLQPGGVGMVCLRRLMDNITFTPQEDGMLLSMERRR